MTAVLTREQIDVRDSVVRNCQAVNYSNNKTRCGSQAEFKVYLMDDCSNRLYECLHCTGHKNYFVKGLGVCPKCGARIVVFSIETI